MSTILTIDGSRGVGKTATAAELVKQLGESGFSAFYFKKGLRDQVSELENTVCHYKVLSLHDSDIVVVDRMAPTELSMSHALHRESPKTLEAYAQIVTDIEKAIGAVTVILRADPELLERRLAARGTRGPDLPAYKVKAAWDYAKSLLPDAIEWKTETGEDYEELMAWLVPYLIGKIKQQREEPKMLSASLPESLQERR
jgi:thymidylate kinase